MDDVRGYFLVGPPHGTTPAAAIANKNKTEEWYVLKSLRDGMRYIRSFQLSCSLDLRYVLFV